jgi:hypothetical protein
MVFSIDFNKTNLYFNNYRTVSDDEKTMIIAADNKFEKNNKKIYDDDDNKESENINNSVYGKTSTSDSTEDTIQKSYDDPALAANMLNQLHNRNLNNNNINGMEDDISSTNNTDDKNRTEDMSQKSYDPILAAYKFNNNINFFQPLQTNLIDKNNRIADVSISLTSNQVTNAVINHGNNESNNNQASLTTITDR